MFDRLVDKLADALKILVDRVVWNAKDSQAATRDRFCPDGVPQNARRLIVLRAVQLNDEAGGMTVKIDDIAVDHLLPQEADRVSENRTTTDALPASYSSADF